MKACIIVPPSPFLDDDKVIPPLGALYIKRYVQENSNHTVDVLVNKEKDLSEYSVVGFSSVTANIKYVEKLLPLPNKITVLGGPHVTFYRNDLSPLLRNNITYLISGDGCEPFLSILNGEPIEYLPDHKNQMPWRGKELSNYNYYMYNLKATTMITSRGCPNRCYFCEDANIPLRFKDIETIDKEIKECIDLGYKFISISDDMFCISNKRVKNVSVVMKKYNMKFRCLARANIFNKEMAEILANNGCLEVGFGAESGSQKILDIINKRITVEEIKRTINIIKDCGMIARASFMIGLPGETKKTLKETYNLIKNSRLNDFVAFIYHPYRGTYIYDNIEEFDIQLPENYNDTMHLLGKNATVPETGVRTKSLTSEEIFAYHEKFRKLKKKLQLKNMRLVQENAETKGQNIINSYIKRRF